MSSYWRLWQGVKPEDVVALARKMKTLCREHQVQYELNLVRVGAEAGQWEGVTSFTDWESYGKFINNEDRLSLLAEAARLGQQTGARLVTRVDL
jgi:hypothetical protein